MSKKRILIVDDDQALTRLMKHRLDNEGYDVCCASGGAEGLERVKHFQPDLIILDLIMDDMDGYEVTRKLKSDLATCSIPILILSVLRGLEDRLTALFLGALEFLSKPYDPQRLVQTVQKMLVEEKQSLADEEK